MKSPVCIPRIELAPTVPEFIYVGFDSVNEIKVFVYYSAMLFDWAFIISFISDGCKDK